MTKISQREARRLLKEVMHLRSWRNIQRDNWAADWPGGVNIATLDAKHLDVLRSAVKTSRMLRHAVVVTVREECILFYALPLGAP